MNDFDQLHDKFIEFMEQYGSIYERVKNEDDYKNSFRDIISRDIPDLIRECVPLNYPYIVNGSYGKGRWTTVPWIAVFDQRITTSAQKGVYIVYLLNKDTKDLYLTLNQGATNTVKEGKKQNGRSTFNASMTGASSDKNLKLLRENAEAIRNGFSEINFEYNDEINTGSANYDAGAICYKKYTIKDMPSGNQLIQDLRKMLELYSFYSCSLGNDSLELKNDELNTNELESEEIEHTLTPKETIEHIKNYISSKGFTYSGKLIENFYLCMKSKPFTILAGTSGTGKTRLVKLFAEAIGITDGRFKLVPVRPDWSDSSDLFGHLDLNGNYVAGEILEFIAKAQREPNRPYILCLDEMNLARVEYYLSDFLSVIETREVQGESGKIVSEPLVTLEQYGTDAGARSKFGEIRFPQNLYLVGTVNMDETTFPFSRKVLDRANTIEFDFVDLNSIPDTDVQAVKPVTVPNEFLRTKYLFLNQCMDNPKFVGDICKELQKINEVLQKANAHVGYRVRDEIVFYMVNNKEADLLADEEAMDNEIMQKILPRIQGSSVSVKVMLCELFRILAGDYDGYQTKSGDVASKMTDKLDKMEKNGEKIQYPKSARKVAFMVRRFEEDGFTSYWL